MGKILEELTSLINKQLDDHRVVIWYDPEHAYEQVIDSLSFPETSILRYQGSFFELRYRLEPFLECVDEEGNLIEKVQSRALVYLPLEQNQTQYALIEAEKAGTFMAPGASPWQRNTRLKVIAERIFKQIAPEQAPSIAAKVDAGEFTLADLEKLAEQTGEMGAVKLIFGTSAATDVLLSFVASVEYDKEIADKRALGELATLCNSELGLRISADQSVEQFRHKLVRSLLLAELALRVKAAGGTVSALAALTLLQDERRRRELLDLCQQWRNRLDLQESYTDWAGRVEVEAQVVGFDISPELLIDVETFLAIELRLVNWVEEQLLSDSTTQALEAIERRRDSFWSRQNSERKLHWLTLGLAANVLRSSWQIELQHKPIRSDAQALVGAYVNGIDQADEPEAFPWFLLDQQYRHFELQLSKLELYAQEYNELERLTVLVRSRYASTVARTAEAFADALEACGYQVEWLAQRQIFSKKAQSVIWEGKTAFILVDSLRYEMGQELATLLEGDLGVKLSPALAQLPTITEVGMAALMPAADQSIELVSAGKGKVGLQIQGSLLKDRSSRVKYFESSLGKSVLVLKLSDLSRPTKSRQQEIEQADVLLVTSQEIDHYGEEINEEETRRFVSEALEKLSRGIRQLIRSGIKNIVVAADHGHIFVENLNEVALVSPPGGKTADVHARVWIGQGGSAAPGFRRVKAAQLSLAGELEMAFPLGLANFSVPGKRSSYFHGGISLQETVIPVIEITASEESSAVSGLAGAATVQLTLAKTKITTRLFSITALYLLGGLFGEQAKKVRISVQAGKTEVGSIAFAGYGFKEGAQEVELENERPNAITLMLTRDVLPETVSVHVIDVTTQVELAAVKEIPVEIAI